MSCAMDSRGMYAVAVVCSMWAAQLTKRVVIFVKVVNGAGENSIATSFVIYSHQRRDGRACSVHQRHKKLSQKTCRETRA
jgi:hypothetical protein